MQVTREGQAGDNENQLSYRGTNVTCSSETQVTRMSARKWP